MSEPSENRQHFERPETWLNRRIRRLTDALPHAELPQGEVERLRDNSLEVFQGIVMDHEALAQIREVPWYVADEPCPKMVLGGEVTMATNGAEPEVRFFPDAPVLAIRSPRRREANLLGSADHFTGHLYAFFTGARDYDEHAAVYWQNRAARARFEAGDTRFRAKPLVNMVAYRYHKGIPFGVYSPWAQSIRGLQRPTVEIERCELRDEVAPGWMRITTRNEAGEVITGYQRPLLSMKPDRLTEIPLHAAEEAYEITLSGSDPGTFDSLWVHRKGRPCRDDEALLRSLTEVLDANQVLAKPKELKLPGGYPHVLGN